MEYVHVKKIEKYNPGYQDRNLIWCKAYFTMINADPDFELLEEIDKWRLIAFIMLELQIKKPVPLNRQYLERKGFNLKKRPIQLTINMLHNFLEVVTIPLRREDKIREDIYIREKSVTDKDKEKHGDFVALKHEEYNKLVNTYGKSIVKTYIDKLNNYIGSKGKRYKSHYYTILVWMNKDGVRKQAPAPALNYGEREQVSEEDRKKVARLVKKTMENLK